jgi:uncharacterized glyoxalase superfamily protein PhnB
MSACMAPYPTIVPYLAVADAAAAIDFYKRAFGAEERLRVPGPDRTGPSCTPKSSSTAASSC